MSERLQVRRYLYEQVGRVRGVRRRRALRRQIAVLSGGGPGPDDDGLSGVREPRRPAPSSPPVAREP
jgi:hypothetical protein